MNDQLKDQIARRKLVTGVGFLGAASFLVKPNEAKAWVDDPSGFRVNGHNICVSVAAFGALGASPPSPANPLAPLPLNERTHIQNALNSLQATGGTVVLDPTKRYFISGGGLVIPDGVTLAGNFSRPDFKNYLTVPPYPDTPNLVGYGSQLVLDDTAWISLGFATCLKNILILHKNITRIRNSSPSVFSSTTAVAIDGGGAMVRDCFIGGFNRAIESRQGRPVIDGVWGDNHYGILITNCQDIGRISNCHFWPFLTVGSTTGVGDMRGGAAFKVEGLVEWLRVFNCFSFGYQRGFWFAGGDRILLSMCGADNNKDFSNGSIGYLIQAPGHTFHEVRIDMCQAAGNTIGVYGEASGGPRDKIFVTNSDFWYNSSTAYHTGGSANCTARLNGNTFRNSTYGIFQMAAGRVYSRDNNFHENGTDVVNGGLVTDLGGNLYNL